MGGADPVYADGRESMGLQNVEQTDINNKIAAPFDPLALAISERDGPVHKILFSPPESKTQNNNMPIAQRGWEKIDPAENNRIGGAAYFVGILHAW